MRDAKGIPPPTAAAEIQPTDAKRIKGFATFFKNYMSVSTVVVAAAPIPLTAARLIPTFDAQRGLIMTLSSLLSFLLLAYVFFNRVTLGRAYFYGRAGTRIFSRMLPLIAIIVCGSAMFLYLTQFEQSLVTPDGIDTDFTRIPNAQLLISLQVLFYVAAELAFILMALREYLQDLLGITDVEQIVPRMRTADEIQHDTLLAEEAALAVHSGRASIEYDHPTDTRLTIKLQNGHQFTVLREPFDARLSSLSISSPRVEMPTTSRSKGTPAIE